MSQCIYCLEIKPASGFSREHVLPDGFGGFSEDALTLDNMVCAACNQFFGDTIDRVFGRSSPEGLDRYRFGIKKPKDIHNFSYKEVRLLAPELNGILLEQGHFPEYGWCAVPRAQLGFARRTGAGYKFFSAESIVAGEWREDSEIDLSIPPVSLTIDDDEYRAFCKMLREGGINFEPNPLGLPPSGGQIQVQEIMIVTPEKRRIVAKIAMNYLAKIKGSEFVLRPEFNPLRRFVRLAEEPDSEIVHANVKPLLHVNRGGVPALAHTLYLFPDQTGTKLLIHVRLFSGMTYLVESSLCALGDMNGTRAAHLFDIATMRAQRLRID